MSNVYARIVPRYQGPLLLAAMAGMMLLSFAWYLPGAFQAGSMDGYHVYSWQHLNFTNIVDLYVLHFLDRHHAPGFILSGPGIDYPAILSLLVRATATLEGWTPGTGAGANVPTFLLANYAVIFVFGLITIALLARWPGARPWMFVASPILALHAGYNWDLVHLALSLGGILLLARSLERPDAGFGYNRGLEIAGVILLTLGVWFKLFPAVFLLAAWVERGRRGLWPAVGLGAAVALVLSVLINLPLILANYPSWYFFLWFNQNRAVEPSSIWYLLLGSIDLALPARPDSTVAINLLSLAALAAGALGVATLAWRSPRRAIVVPAGCLLLVWWLLFNKLYDPNFDLILLFALAVLGAPRWLPIALAPFSLLWYVTAIGGLSFLTLGANDPLNAWYVGHVLMYMIGLRLLVMAVIFAWILQRLLTPERQTDGDVRMPSTALAVQPRQGAAVS